jgi:hypothetical protein
MSRAVHHEDGVLRVSSEGHLLLAIWVDAPRIEQMSALTRITEAHHRRLGADKQVMMHAVLGGTPDFTEEVRKASADLIRRSSSWRAATAWMIPLSGLRGVAVRSLVSTIFLLGRSASPMRVFERPEPAGAWLLPHLQKLDRWDMARFLAAYQAALPRSQAAAQR